MSKLLKVASKVGRNVAKVKTTALQKYNVNDILEDIKKSFSIQEPIDEMRNMIMQKIMEASKLESRVSEGENCCKDVNDKEIQRNIDSLSLS
jgi:hypothetical protein